MGNIKRAAIFLEFSIVKICSLELNYEDSCYFFKVSGLFSAHISTVNSISTVNFYFFTSPIVYSHRLLQRCTVLNWECPMTIDYGRSEKIEVNCRNTVNCRNMSTEQSTNFKKIARVLIVQFKRTYFHNG